MMIKAVLSKINGDINYVSVFHNPMTLHMVRIWLQSTGQQNSHEIIVKIQSHRYHACNYMVWSHYLSETAMILLK